MAQNDTNTEVIRLTAIIESERKDRERLQEDVDELKASIAHLKESVAELKLALLGNKMLNQEGLVGMFHNMQARLDLLVGAFDRNKSFAKGLLAIVTILLTAAGVATAWDGLKKFFGH